MQKPDDFVTKRDLEFHEKQLKSYVDLKIIEKFTDFYFYILKGLYVIAIIALLIVLIKLP